MLTSTVKRLLLFTRHLGLRAFGARVEAPKSLGGQISCRLGYGREGRGRIHVGPAACIEQGAILHAYGGSIHVGRNVVFGQYTVVYGHGGVEIGDECLIAMHSRILSSEHTVPSADISIRSQPDILKSTRIGRDVWLGAGVTVLGGVVIGDGCVVGAGAVVTKDLPPFSIAVGVPAKVVGRRPGASSA